MATNNFVPDFEAIKKIDFAKPSIEKEDILVLIGTGLAILALIWAFIPWASVSVSAFGMSESASALGITLWYGILYFICALVMMASYVYRQYNVALIAGGLCVLFAIIGLISDPTISANGESMKFSAAKAMQKGFFGAAITASRLGNLFALLFSAGASVLAFMKVNKG